MPNLILQPPFRCSRLMLTWVRKGLSNATNALLVDITPGMSGAAVAANNLTRCLTGAVGIAVIKPMIDGMVRFPCL